MKRTLALVVAALLFGAPICSLPSIEPKQGSICIQPLPVHSSFMLCVSGKLSIRVDSRHSIPWPHQNPMKIDGLDVTWSHRVIVGCNAKSVQAAIFRFSDYQSDELCLIFDSMFDGYEGMRLFDPKQASWCKKCK